MPIKRQRKPQAKAGSTVKRNKASLDLGAKPADDDFIHSSSDEEDSRGREPALEEESEDDEPLETKKVRLAREYLDKIDGASASSSSSDSEEESEDEENRDYTARKLQRARMKKEGTYERAVVQKVTTHVQSFTRTMHETASMKDWVDRGHIHLLRGHDLTPTCVALLGEDKAISGSKDHSVILWDIESQSRITNISPQWRKSKPTEDHHKFRTQGQVLAVACSDDGRYAAVGRRNATVQIYDVRAKSNYNLVHTFDGHKGAVTCLAFQSGTTELFSGSEDRCIRHYTLKEMMYLETLYGHQFGVTAMDCLSKERPVSVSSDRTARAWKLAEDTHLIFRGGAKVQAAESISLVKEDWFLTGHQDGHLSLWLTEKKKAVLTVANAHGFDEGGVGRSIVSVSALRNSDFAASGSCDGFLRFWNVETGARLQERSLQPAFTVPLSGYVNSIAFGPRARFCVAAVGPEHRLGRWARIAGAKSRLAIINLRNPDLVDDIDVDQEKGLDSESASEIESRSDDSSAASAME